jgi:hypothetical protein
MKVIKTFKFIYFRDYVMFYGFIKINYNLILFGILIRSRKEFL